MGVGVNLWAVIVAAIINMVVGMFWYSPTLFGNEWMKLVGLSKKDMEKAKKKGMGKTYLLAAITSLIMASVLSLIISYMGPSAAYGLKTGFIVWLGFVATFGMNVVLWEGKPMQLYLINSGYALVSLLLMGLVIGSWA